jgi:hypothetical protein
MKTPSCLLCLPLSFVALSLSFVLRADAADYKSELFRSTKLVYADSFEGTLNAEFWEVRQNTTWAVKDGVLHGSESSKEFQAKKKASDDPSHAGSQTGDVAQEGAGELRLHHARALRRQRPTRKARR